MNLTCIIGNNKHLTRRSKTVVGLAVAWTVLNVCAGSVLAGTTGTSASVKTSAEVLAEAKTAAHAVLTAALAAYISTNYTATNWTALNGFKAAGDTAIDAATTVEGVTAAQTAATTGMAGVRTIAQGTDWLISTVKRTDFVRDGVIDVLDFNALMVQWGKTGVGNSADANQDGLVDIFDFNLLMVYWGQTEPL